MQKLFGPFDKLAPVPELLEIAVDLQGRLFKAGIGRSVGVADLIVAAHALHYRVRERPSLSSTTTPTTTAWPGLPPSYVRNGSSPGEPLGCRLVQGAKCGTVKPKAERLARDLAGKPGDEQLQQDQ